MNLIKISFEEYFEKLHEFGSNCEFVKVDGEKFPSTGLRHSDDPENIYIPTSRQANINEDS
jgi:hypothetical protein